MQSPVKQHILLRVMSLSGSLFSPHSLSPARNSSKSSKFQAPLSGELRLKLVSGTALKDKTHRSISGNNLFTDGKQDDDTLWCIAALQLLRV